VKDRLPDTLNTLCNLEILSPDVVLSRKTANIDALLDGFPNLAQDPSLVEEEFRSLIFARDTTSLKSTDDPVQFWLSVLEVHDSAG
uniref:Uncharacterized protein n=1 Tax=Romanomermis culicivorax TaxID=13658 RepID=A0A915JN39_ROMCU